MRRTKDIKSSELMDLLRNEKSALLPPWGGWVTVLGNPYAPRGLRIPPAIHELGVHHLDIYYAYDEGCPWHYTETNPLDLDGTVAELIIDYNRIPPAQLTWMTLHTPSSQQIRMYCGEVRPFTEELIKDMLEVNYLEAISFGTNQLTRPIWDELTRDMIGSLQLDGLSYQEAQFELLAAGEQFERDPQLPPYFFRAMGAYKDRFCEEED